MNYLVPTSANYYKWMPYMFCDQINPLTYQDSFKFVFEQDCRSNVNHYDWFIFKVKVSDIGTLANIPHEAAYFGDETGDEIAQSIAIDEFGYIYIAGYSTSTDFGIAAGETALLYAKTHFTLTWEINKSFAGDANQAPGYLNKRFVEPKKFNNANGGGKIFTRDLTGSIAAYPNGFAFVPYSINEDTFTGTVTYTTGWITSKGIT